MRPETPSLAPSAAANPPSTKAASGRRRPLRTRSRCANSTLLLVLLAIWIFFYVATNGTFLTQRNLVLLALQTSIVSLAAISAVMLIVTRNFDLSVGSAVALVGVVFALMTVRYDVHPAIAIAAALGVGVAHGRVAGLVGDADGRLVLHRHPRRACSISAAFR